MAEKGKICTFRLGYLKILTYKQNVGISLKVGTLLISTGVVLITISGKIPIKEVSQPSEQYWFSAG